MCSRRSGVRRAGRVRVPQGAAAGGTARASRAGAGARRRRRRPRTRPGSSRTNAAARRGPSPVRQGVDRELGVRLEEGDAPRPRSPRARSSRSRTRGGRRRERAARDASSSARWRARLALGLARCAAPADVGVAGERAEPAAGRVEQDGVERPRERRPRASAATTRDRRRRPSGGAGARSVRSRRAGGLRGDHARPAAAEIGELQALAAGGGAGVEHAAARRGERAHELRADVLRVGRAVLEEGREAALDQRARAGDEAGRVADAGRGERAESASDTARVGAEVQRRAARAARGRGLRPRPGRAASSQRFASQRGSEPYAGQPQHAGRRRRPARRAAPRAAAGAARRWRSRRRAARPLARARPTPTARRAAATRVNSSW